MDKKLFADLVASLKQAGEIARGSRPASRVFSHPQSRVKAIRKRTKLSQTEFALLMGVSVKTLQNWEQARREPRGPAAALLRIVERAPEVALRALSK
jgi:putative transcriptional regulator